MKVLGLAFNVVYNYSMKFIMKNTFLKISFLIIVFIFAVPSFSLAQGTEPDAENQLVISADKLIVKPGELVKLTAKTYSLGALDITFNTAANGVFSPANKKCTTPGDVGIIIESCYVYFYSPTEDTFKVTAEGSFIANPNMGHVFAKQIQVKVMKAQLEVSTTKPSVVLNEVSNIAFKTSDHKPGVSITFSTPTPGAQFNPASPVVTGVNGTISINFFSSVAGIFDINYSATGYNSGTVKITVAPATTPTDSGTDAGTTNTTPDSNTSDYSLDPLSGSSSGKIENPLKVNNLFDFIKIILQGAVKIGIPIIALAIIYSGFLFVKAQGNSEAIEKAKSTLIYTLIGAAILIGAWSIAQLVANTILAL